MKVLQINSVCGIKSTGRICTDLDGVLRNKGYESRILYGREAAPSKFAHIAHRVATPTEVKWQALSSRLFDNAGFSLSQSGKRVIAEIEQYNPDIIHLHNLHGYYLNVDVLFDYLKGTERKIVWTLHDCWAFTGHCTHFCSVRCDKWRTGCFGCIQKKQYPAAFITDNSKRNYLRKKDLFTKVPGLQIVTPSQWLADVACESFLNEYPIRVIPNGVNMQIFKSGAKDPYKGIVNGDKRILLGVATSWTDRKGLYDFIELSRMIDPNRYQIVLVGVTKKQANRLPKSVICLEQVNSAEEMAAYYAHAYALLSLSKEESMGLTVVEALACGTPVAVYDATALPEMVTEECGIVIEQGNLEHLVQNLDRLVELSPCACIAQASRYEKEKMYQKYISLYEELMQ